MCSIDDPPASTVVAEQINYKQQSLANPDGVQFMDHLWEMIESIDQPLTVVLRTDQDVFDDIPIKAFWLLRASSITPQVRSCLTCPMKSTAGFNRDMPKKCGHGTLEIRHQSPSLKYSDRTKKEMRFERPISLGMVTSQPL